MQIGELSDRTGTPRRLLRYYEEQGLIGATRLENGYRNYSESCVAKVSQIRGLLDAGLTTRVIREILPCTDSPRTVQISEASPETLQLLSDELMKIEQRIECLQRNRAAVADYLQLVRSSTADHAVKPVQACSFASGA